MTNGDDNRLFIDTNVLVYATVPEAPFSELARRTLAAQLTAGSQFWIQGSAQPWILPDPKTPGVIHVVAPDDPDNDHRFTRPPNSGHSTDGT